MKKVGLRNLKDKGPRGRNGVAPVPIPSTKLSPPGPRHCAGDRVGESVVAGIIS